MLARGAAVHRRKQEGKYLERKDPKNCIYRIVGWLMPCKVVVRRNVVNRLENQKSSNSTGVVPNVMALNITLIYVVNSFIIPVSKYVVSKLFNS